MSGGHFDYLQFRLNDIAVMIKDLINGNNIVNKYGNSRNYKPKTILQFQNAIYHLEIAQAYAHRIDMLVSNDDCEDNFHIILQQDLSKCEKKNK